MACFAPWGVSAIKKLPVLPPEWPGGRFSTFFRGGMAGGSLQPFFEGWNGRGVVLALEPWLPETQNYISNKPRGSFLDDSIEYRKAARRRRLGGDGRPLVCVPLINTSFCVWELGVHFVTTVMVK